MWGIFFSESFPYIFFGIFFHKHNTVLFGIGLLRNLFQSHKNICFEAIQNGDKSNRILEQMSVIFGGLKEQLMWNFSKNMKYVRRSMF